MVIVALLNIDPFGDRVQPGRGSAVVVLIAFLAAFLAVRTSARLTRSVSWWPGGVETDGVHIHHLVWGICLMMLCGFLAFAAPLRSPWWLIEAAGFGIGAGFTLDEFALWVRLEDVYWSKEGRASVDAVVVACAFAGLVVAGVQPFGLDDPVSISGTAVTIAVVLAIVAVCAAKDRVILAVIGMFIPIVGVVGAVRLGRPSSPWARRFYDPAKLDRARKRFAGSRRIARVATGLQDAIAGAPNRDPPAP
jgi:hypothetical protein